MLFMYAKKDKFSMSTYVVAYVKSWVSPEIVLLQMENLCILVIIIKSMCMYKIIRYDCLIKAPNFPRIFFSCLSKFPLLSIAMFNSKFPLFSVTFLYIGNNSFSVL